MHEPSALDPPPVKNEYVTARLWSLRTVISINAVPCCKLQPVSDSAVSTGGGAGGEEQLARMQLPPCDSHPCVVHGAHAAVGSLSVVSSLVH